MTPGASVLLAVGSYLAGVAIALLLLLVSCARCQQDNAYIGLFLLAVVLTAFAGFLVVAGIATRLRRGPWVAAAGIPVWLVVGVGTMIFIGNPFAAFLLPFVSLLGAVLAGGRRELGLALAAAAAVGVIAAAGGTSQWGTLGFDPLVLGAIALFVPVVAVAAQRAQRRAAPRVPEP